MKILVTVACAIVSFGSLALLAIEPGTAVAATPFVIAPTVSGFVRDGLEGPKDGIPDTVIPFDIPQTLDVPLQEDRGIFEFNISSLSGPVRRARLILPVFAATGPFPFRIDVFSYVGDGVLSLSDFDAGTLFTSFKYSGPTVEAGAPERTLRLDVTSLINNLLALGEGYAGFNLQFSIPSSILLNGPFISFHSAYLRVMERNHFSHKPHADEDEDD